MSTVDADRFAEFFEAINGHGPFPWQDQLCAQVLREGAWPDLVDVPTGLGKTSMIDIAVYALAATAGDAGGPGRRRVFFVVDRRLVVDEAWLHACALAEKLADAQDGIVAEVARALRSLRGADGDQTDPLTVTRMRGGATWDAAWVDRPDQPAIVLGTVDQIGSRLLFRGYGVSDQRRPMDAALVGVDSLVLVDEAHLARPLLRTVANAFALDQADLPLPRATIVSLTATPDSGDASRFEFDVDTHRGDGVAWQRLTAPKSLELVESDPKSLAAALVEQTVGALTIRPGARALLVCNTVDTARAVHTALAPALRKAKLALAMTADGQTHAVELLIGRARPIDREARIDGVLGRFGLDRPRDDGRVDVLVATQTVEVGANLDVDVLVTESASLSALVQRIGRLNRLGRSGLDPVAIVVHNGQADDPLYGTARSTVWDFLSDLASRSPESVSVGPLALRHLLATAPADVLAERPVTTPMLLPGTLRAWAQTSPAPDPDPILGPYLHGLERDARTVSLLWRDDVDDDLDRSADHMTTFPVVAAETMDVPLRAVRAWLTGSAKVATSDLDDEEKVDDPAAPPRRVAPPPVLVARRDGWAPTDPQRLRPGDVVALPATRGGLDEFGWNPASEARVSDVRDLATLGARKGQPMLRLDARTAGRVIADRDPDARADLNRAVHAVHAAHGRDPDQDDGLAGSAANAGEPNPAQALDDAVTELIATLNAALAQDVVVKSYRHLIEALAGPAGTPASGSDLETVELAGGEVILRKRRTFEWQIAADVGRTDSSASKGRVTLTAHHDSVARRARAICAALALSPELAEIVTSAAGHHDLGKLDVRFQAALSDGDVFLAALVDEPLAKSGIHPRSVRAREARKRSRLPRGFRHETWSAALVEQVLADSGRDERDLTVHLVATHHGNCRPYFEPVVDKYPEKLTHEHSAGTAVVETESCASSDLATVSRFDRLNARFGYWGLAMLETIVRSADQTCSAEGS